MELLTEGVVPLLNTLPCPRQPLSSQLQRMKLHQALIAQTPPIPTASVSNVKILDIFLMIIQITKWCLVEEDMEIEDEDDFLLETNEHAAVEEETIYNDRGEAVVVQRSPKVTNVEDEWLRNNIFHARCTSHGKVYNVIINEGSCKSVVAITMVEKQKLKTEDHPEPYKLQWLRKGNEVKVNKICLVEFLIGKNYKDAVVCDIVPMDTCHLLLGRM